MVGTNSYTKKIHKFYYSMVQDISRRVGDCSTKVGALCARFFDMWDLVKTQVENRLNKILKLRGQTIYVADQAILTFKYLGLRYE